MGILLLGGASFTPAWRSVRTSGGGALQSIHAYSDGTVLTHGDTFGPWLYKTSGTVQLDGTIYTAPAWQVLMTSDSLPAGDVNTTTAYSDNTTAWCIAAAASNTSIIYAAYCNKLYYTINKGVTWIESGVTETFNPNGTFNLASPLAVDPANPDVVYFVTVSSGVKTTSAGSTGGSWSLISTSTIPASSNSKSGCVLFDPSQGTSGGKTKRILISVSGVGVYESTDAGATWTFRNSGSPPTNVYQMSVDSFGQVWATEGFSANTIYKFASGTWSKVFTGDQIVAIFQDPLFGGSVGSNQVIGCANSGQIWCSLNNGSTWSAANGSSNPSLVSNSPQAGWLNVINQYDNGGDLSLNLIMADIDSSGKIWGATGIDVFTTPDPITSGVVNGSVTWSANTIGIDQLVTNKILSIPNSIPVLAVWDRGLFPIINPDTFAPSQFPNHVSPASPLNVGNFIMAAWSVDSAPGTFTAAALIAFQTQMTAVSSDGGHTWSLVTNPTGIGIGGVLATSTSLNWACVPIQNTTTIEYTTDGGSTWSAASVSGSPAFWINDYANHRQPLAADSTTAGTFYIIDTSSPRKFFKSTDRGATWSATGATISDGVVQSDRLLTPPAVGSANTAGHTFYCSQNGHIWKSTDGCSSFSDVNSSLDACIMFGFGAPAPGASYPTIYAYQTSGGTLAQGFYQSTDGGTTWRACSLPASESVWPMRVMDLPNWLSGDANVYGRIYIGFAGSTACYVDTQDACPYVNFTNVAPNATLTGTETITAQHSGLVPVSSVTFQVDGSTIATFTGNGPYSTSWNTAGVAHGAHTLTVTAAGLNGSASFAIPITTS